ncbi:MAG TPA: discoidin domain-containing protein [Vicinamibacteria bacterium]|nr:discoidin domain-containing protein [Vicinamibacteria bacterium]
MSKCEAVKAKAERQKWVARIVWGIAFIVMGILFTLENMGRIDMRGPGRYPPSNAVDGRSDTRWSSAFAEPQWIAVDLQQPADISRVRLTWESAFASEYEIEVSDDGSHWTTVDRVTRQGGDSVDERLVKSRGRYVRVKGTKRATPYGISLWELEVFGTPEVDSRFAEEVQAAPAHLLSSGRPTTASSNEGTNLWALYWPVLLIVSGLPALIAPKDPGDQVIGLLAVGAGVLLELQELRVVAWTFAQSWPTLLIVAGITLVVQAWRTADNKRGGDGIAQDGGAR